MVCNFSMTPLSLAALNAVDICTSAIIGLERGTLVNYSLIYSLDLSNNIGELSTNKLFSAGMMLFNAAMAAVSLSYL